MTGTKIARAMATVAFAAWLALGGCKNGKQGSTAADEKQRAQAPSGTRSLQGLYSYMADAALFLDCATQERYPVATEGDNAALERAYSTAKVAPGARLLVTVEGRLEPRPKVDHRGTEPTLIVERFVRTWPQQTCGDMKKAKLEDTRWTLLELHGKPIAPDPNDEIPYLELNSAKVSAYGFGGCNRFFGAYQATDRALRFSDMGATRMACPEGLDQEQELFRALEATTRYEIHGWELLLFADQALVARFEARAEAE